MIILTPKGHQFCPGLWLSSCFVLNCRSHSVYSSDMETGAQRKEASCIVSHTGQPGRRWALSLLTTKAGTKPCSQVGSESLPPAQRGLRGSVSRGPTDHLQVPATISSPISNHMQPGLLVIFFPCRWQRPERIWAGARPRLGCWASTPFYGVCCHHLGPNPLKPKSEGAGWRPRGSSHWWGLAWGSAGTVSLGKGGLQWAGATGSCSTCAAAWTLQAGDSDTNSPFTAAPTPQPRALPLRQDDSVCNTQDLFLFLLFCTDCPSGQRKNNNSYSTVA